MESRDYRAKARENLEGNWWPAIGIGLVASLLGGSIAGSGSINLDLVEEAINLLPDFILTLITTVASVSTILAIAQLVIGGTVQLGYCRYLLKQHDKQTTEFKDLFSEFDRFGQGFAQAFLRGLYIFLWSLLFIIPGIVKSYSYVMTPFIMAENPDMTASEAINASKAMMDGHKWELFVLDLSFIGWSLLCVLTLNFGYIALNPYRNAAYTVFYRSVKAPAPGSDN